jgi:hypothetical protein
MLNGHVMLSGKGSDEQWAVSVQHKKEGIETNIAAFKEVEGMVRKSDESTSVIEAI